MTDANVIFNNNSLGDDGADEGEFKIGEDESIEYSFGDEAKEKSVENYNEEEFKENPAEEITEEDNNENDIEDVIEELIEEEAREVEEDEEEGEKEEEAEVEEEVEEEKNNDDVVVISKSKVILIEKLLKNIKENNDKVIQLLSGSISSEDEARISIGQISDDSFTGSSDEVDDDSRIIEGVFDGESMIGPDGKQYSMPANYASKSKLIEGDIMKLTITDSGTFVYKQIGPIDRRRVIGTINQLDNGNFIVVDEETGQKWRVLTASVTYYKGQAGDEAVILVPKNGESKWAAVDNVVRRQE